MERFLSQPGTARRFYDSVRREYISRRQMLKRSGVFPESQAQQRRTLGTGRLQGPRSDAGQSHKQRYHLTARTFHIGSKMVEACPHHEVFYRIIVASVFVTSVHVVMKGKREHFYCWRCQQQGTVSGCRSLYGIVEHIVFHHFAQACQS
jgi:hypothetical protein